MSMGYVQQIGTPLELYDKPANLFVANFIGLPAMNLIDVEVKNGYIENESLKLPINNVNMKLLHEYIGKKIVLGIRPDDIYEGGTLPFKVNINENLGQNSLVHGNVNGEKLICKFKSWTNYSENDLIDIRFDENKLHFFDKETTLAINER
jgi:multiple sugar transport system ATP-binding protein